VAEAYGKVPLAFEVNQGQTDKAVQFFGRGNGYSVFLTPTASVLTLHAPADADERGQLRSAPETPRARQSAVLRMALLGSNPKATAIGVEELPGKSNYFIGNDPKQWRTNVPNYGKVRFADVYRGVDLVYYGNQRQLEYDFVVAPGADPSAITLAFAGAERLKIDAEGELALQTGVGEVRWHKPVIYQEVGGVRQTVSGRYVSKGESAVGFEVASYDPRQSLVIDPTLVYSTYLGGSGDDDALGIAIDVSGNAYVTGSTQSATFPTLNPLPYPLHGSSLSGPEDAFVTKLDPAGSVVLYSTYLGGPGNDVGNAIAVDEGGHAYVTGTTDSGFPTTPGQLTVLQGGQDAFVTKLNSAGNGLIYSTYLGGSGNDVGLAIAVDRAYGNAFVTGTTTSTNLPTSPFAVQRTFGGGQSDAFVAALGSSGYPGTYITYLGGSGLEGASFAGIAIDSNDNVYVTGTTYSTNFPVTSGAFQTTLSGTADAFVARLNGSLTVLVYSTLLGGNGFDTGNAIAVDAFDYAYVTGQTNSTNFPTSLTAFQSAPGGNGNNDAFVAKLNPQGTALTYSTYLGGSGQENGTAIAVDAHGNAYVTGGTSSNDFPITFDAFQPAYGGGFGDAFVTKVNADGSALDYSTFLGGSSNDGGTGIVIDGSGNAFVSGGTGGAGFPTTASAFQIVPGGGNDAFVAKISDSGGPASPLPPTLVKVFAPSTVAVGTTTTLTFTLSNPNSATSLSGVGFTDPLPAGMIVATPGGLSNACGGTATAADGASEIDLSGVSISALGKCTVSVTILAVSVSSLANVTGKPMSVEGGAGSAATAVLIVTPAVTTCALTSSPNPSAPGQSVTFTETVGGSNPSGNVTFMDGLTVLGTVALNNAGVATLSSAGLSIGSHSITGSYGGDGNNLSCASGPLTQTVSQSNTTTTLTASPNPSKAGQAVTLTAVVAGYAPTGTVTFSVDSGAQVIGPLPLSGGTATTTLTGLAPGTHLIAASYSGDANNKPSTSPTLTEVVNTGAGKVPTTTILTASASTVSVSAGQPVTFTATVTGATPTGTISFYDANTLLAAVPIDANGVATFTTSAFAQGAHQVTAQYSGDSLNLPSASKPVKVQAVH
jgi:hypothetical protein